MRNFPLARDQRQIRDLILRHLEHQQRGHRHLRLQLATEQPDLGGQPDALSVLITFAVASLEGEAANRAGLTDRDSIDLDDHPHAAGRALLDASEALLSKRANQVRLVDAHTERSRIYPVTRLATSDERRRESYESRRGARHEHDGADG